MMVSIDLKVLNMLLLSVAREVSSELGYLYFVEVFTWGVYVSVYTTECSDEVFSLHLTFDDYASLNQDECNEFIGGLVQEEHEYHNS